MTRTPPTVSEASELRLAETVVWQADPAAADAAVPQRVYVLDLEAEVPAVLEGSSAVIWAALTRTLDLADPVSSVSAAEVTAEVSSLTGIPAERLSGDVLGFLREVSALGLVRGLG